MTKTLYIDARGLNYPKRTGINTLTLHTLYQLYRMQNQVQIRCILIGLRQANLEDLQTKYPWLNDLIDSSISLGEYLRLPVWLHHDFWLKCLNITLELITLFKGNTSLRALADKHPDKNSVLYLWLPQPKSLPIPSQAILLVSIHDIFALKDPLSLSFGERIRENPKIYRTLCQRANYVIANSFATARDIAKLCKFEDTDSRIHWVYPALPQWSVLSKEDQNERAVVRMEIQSLMKGKLQYYAAISGIEPRKNWHTLLMAHALLIERYPDYTPHLVLAGYPVSQSYVAQLHSLIRQHSIPRVEFFTSLSEAEKAIVIQHSIAVVYPSLYEGFGFPILEAFQHQKAVITGVVSSMVELCGEAGVVVNPLDVEDVASAMYIVWKDDNFRKRLESGVASQLAQFDWDETQRFWWRVFLK